MDWKGLFRRFRSWKIDPFIFEAKFGEQHKCVNCGYRFEGIFCPVCSQRYNVGRLGWKSIGRDIGTLLKLKNPGGLISFVGQLFGRTGYMIHDYLKGRRRVCNTPVTYLILIALFAVLISNAVESRSSNYEALLIFPTWLLFRHAPKYPKHTIPEGFYIQVFMSCLVLFIVVLRCFLPD